MTWPNPRSHEEAETGSGLAGALGAPGGLRREASLEAAKGARPTGRRWGSWFLFSFQFCRLHLAQFQYVQCCFVLVSGAQYSKQTVIHFEVGLLRARGAAPGLPPTRSSRA